MMLSWKYFYFISFFPGISGINKDKEYISLVKCRVAGFVGLSYFISFQVSDGSELLLKLSTRDCEL